MNRAGNRSVPFSFAALTATATIGAMFLSPPALATESPTPTAPTDVSVLNVYPTVACDPNGVTSSDNALATQLNAQLQETMRGYMTGYRVSCARMIVSAVKNRGLHQRAATIAVTTAIVESTLQNISVEVDHDSLGLFQQRASWGTREQRLDVTWATNAFLDKMLREYPESSWMTAPVGEVCQTVQVSAYPDRYEVQAGDGAIIAAALWSNADLSREAFADYNGDGKTDAVLYRPSTAEWNVWHTGGSAGVLHTWGNPGDVLIPADYNGDGKTDAAIYRPSTAEWIVWHTGGSAGTLHSGWGNTGDIPIPADYNGDGKTDAAIYRPSTAEWIVWHTGGTAGTLHSGWGNTGDILIPADYNGDGKTDAAVYRPSTKTWHVWYTGGSAGILHTWGNTGDIPVIPHAARRTIPTL